MCFADFRLLAIHLRVDGLGMSKASLEFEDFGSWAKNATSRPWWAKNMNADHPAM
jgi:hypothetical protein